MPQDVTIQKLISDALFWLWFIILIFSARIPFLRIRGSSDGIVTKLQVGRPMNRISIRRSFQEILFLRKRPDRHWDPHSLCFLAFEGLLPGVQWPRNEVDHSLLASALVKNKWNCTFIPPFAYMTCTGSNLPFIIKKRKQACIRRLSACPHFQLLNQFTAFHKIWFDCYAVVYFTFYWL